MMSVDQVTELLLKHLQGELSPEEQSRLDAWLSASAHNRHFFNEINNEEQLQELILAFHPEEELANENAILAKINHQVHRKRIHVMRRWSWAAAILILMLGAAFWIFRPSRQQPVTVAQSTDIAPGSHGAILTLSDGSQLVLDSLQKGTIAQQQGAQVVLKDDGLVYDPAASTSGAVAFNTVTTPRGRQFQITLPDGTKVWMNAASSITYPTVFKGKERSVKVSGEVYFEVAQLASMPFRVNVNDQTNVQVLGTSFNLNAYADEKDMRTTLLEGAVRVENITLKPGQQALVMDGRTELVNHVDVSKVMAWKNGLFNFEGASLSKVMRELARWYDIDVVYEKGIPDITFGGSITRGVSLKGLLSGLEGSEVHFRIEGRKLIVLP